MPRAPQADRVLQPIQDYLSAPDIAKLKDGYKRDEMNALLSKLLPRIYAPSHGYLDAISNTFLGDLPPDDPSHGQRTSLSLQDRERCIIALLAARAEGVTLGLHIYIALMEEISPEEIANIILLVGVYTGVDNVARGLLTEVDTLTALKELLTVSQDLSVGAVFKTLGENLSG
jgi:alkylhydroperoxidase/carboxymuconolactone decarboxylase family protein YurZ